MTQRGNKGKDTITVYLDEKVRIAFKTLCATTDLSMSEVLEAFVSDDKAPRQFINNYKKKSEGA